MPYTRQTVTFPAWDPAAKKMTELETVYVADQVSAQYPPIVVLWDIDGVHAFTPDGMPHEDLQFLAALGLCYDRDGKQVYQLEPGGEDRYTWLSQQPLDLQLARVSEALGIVPVPATQRVFLLPTAQPYQQTIAMVSALKELPGYGRFSAESLNELNQTVLTKLAKGFPAIGEYLKLAKTFKGVLSAVDPSFSGEGYDKSGFIFGYLEKYFCGCLENLQSHGVHDKATQKALDALYSNLEAVSTNVPQEALETYRKTLHAYNTAALKTPEMAAALVRAYKGAVAVEPTSFKSDDLQAKWEAAVDMRKKIGTFFSEILGEKYYDAVKLFLTGGFNEKKPFTSGCIEWLDERYFKPLKAFQAKDGTDTPPSVYFKTLWTQCSEYLDSKKGFVKETAEALEAEIQAFIEKIQTVKEKYTPFNVDEMHAVETHFDEKGLRWFCQDYYRNMFDGLYSGCLTNGNKGLLFEYWRPTLQELNAQECFLVDDNLNYKVEGAFVHANPKQAWLNIAYGTGTLAELFGSDFIGIRLQPLLKRRPPMEVLAKLATNKVNEAAVRASVEGGFKATYDKRLEEKRQHFIQTLPDEGASSTGQELGARVAAQTSVATKAARLAKAELDKYQKTLVQKQIQIQRQIAVNAANHGIFDGAIAAVVKVASAADGRFNEKIIQPLLKQAEALKDNPIYYNRFAAQFLEWALENLGHLPEAVVDLFEEAKVADSKVSNLFLFARFLKAITANIVMFAGTVSEVEQKHLQGVSEAYGRIALQASFETLEPSLQGKLLGEGVLQVCPDAADMALLKTCAYYQSGLFEEVNTMVQRFPADKRLEALVSNSVSASQGVQTFQFEPDQSIYYLLNTGFDMSGAGGLAKVCKYFYLMDPRKQVALPLSGIQRFLNRSKEGSVDVFALYEAENSRLIYRSGRGLGSQFSDPVSGKPLIQVSEVAGVVTIKAASPVGFNFKQLPKEVLPHSLAVGNDQTHLFAANVNPSIATVRAAIDQVTDLLRLDAFSKLYYAYCAELLVRYFQNPSALRPEEAVECLRVLYFLKAESRECIDKGYRFHDINGSLEKIRLAVREQTSLQRLLASPRLKVHAVLVALLSIFLPQIYELLGDFGYFIGNYSEETLTFLLRYLVPQQLIGLVLEFAVYSFFVHLSAQKIGDYFFRGAFREEGPEIKAAFDEAMYLTRLEIAEKFLRFGTVRDPFVAEDVLRRLNTLTTALRQGEKEWATQKVALANLPVRGEIGPPYTLGERRVVQVTGRVFDGLTFILPLILGAVAINNGFKAQNAPEIQDASGDFIRGIMTLAALGGGTAGLSPMIILSVMAILILVPETIFVDVARFTMGIMQYFRSAEPEQAVLESVAVQPSFFRASSVGARRGSLEGVFSQQALSEPLLSGGDSELYGNSFK